MQTRLVMCFLAGYLLVGDWANSQAPSADDKELELSELQRRVIRFSVETLCVNATLTPSLLTSLGLPVSSVTSRRLERRSRTVGTVSSFTQGNWHYRAQRLHDGSRLRRISVDVMPQDKPERPIASVVADTDCQIQGGRFRPSHASDIPTYVYQLTSQLLVAMPAIAVNPAFDTDLSRAPFNPTVVRVAIVDSGVDYNQQLIAKTLARTVDGKLVGYDFWDMDSRPFDSHPREHPLYVQRHGTRIASIIADEASVAKLVPYRYPRPDMTRMTALIEHANNANVRIVNLSMGSRDKTWWTSYEQAARAHPDILFVVSAGNDGLDIDSSPVWPAAFDLANQITVTSALNASQLAERVNYGAKSVDLMVPAEQMIVTEFDGRARLVSGSSYAAARISSLAACLAAKHPDWRAEQLRDAIFSMAIPASGAARGRVAQGYIDDPVNVERGACQPDLQVAHITKILPTHFAKDENAQHQLAMTIAVNTDSDWQPNQVDRVVKQARDILLQCKVDLNHVIKVAFRGSAHHRYFDERLAQNLLEPLPESRPLVVFLQRSLQQIEYGAQAYGRSNTRRSRWLRNTVWMMADVEHAGVALAHELYHVLADSGLHNDDEGNLMRSRTTPHGTSLSESQCGQLRNMALADQLITPVVQ